MRVGPDRLTLICPKICLLVTALFTAVSAVALEDADPPAPEGLSAPILLLADVSSSRILWKRGEDLPIAPASLSKLMTLHLSLRDSQSGRLDDTGVYAVPPEGSAGAMRPNSSVLGLRKDDQVTLLTLRRAAAVVSANDAAWTLALISSDGDVRSFVRRMNRETLRLGMKETSYTDPDGWSSLSSTTGQDQLTLALAYMRLHPNVLATLHALKIMTYQSADRLSSYPAKPNANLLIGAYQGADGLKTGTIPSAGFHFIATARRENTRLIAVVMGIKAYNYTQGLISRAREAAALLDWGFKYFETWQPAPPPLPDIVVRHGETDYLSLIPGEGLKPVTLRKGSSQRLVLRTDLPEVLTAPIEAGDSVATMQWTLDDQVILSVPVLAEGGVRRRLRLRDIFRFRK